MRTHVIAAAILLAALAPAAFADYTTTILTPSGSLGAIAYAASNGQQAGAVFQPDGSQHAYYWTGAAPGTDYNGTNAGSNINALSATQAAGYVQDIAGDTTAAVWTLGNTTPQLLPTSNTLPYTDTEAVALGGSIIAGFGTAASDGQSHALIWTSPTAAPTDLHTFTGIAGVYSDSHAAGTNGVLVVGNATSIAAIQPHAMLWNLTSSTATDLQNSTTGLQNSEALAIAGNQIVGAGQTTGGTNEALLWTLSGTDDSVITPSTLVIPTNYIGASAGATNGSLIVGDATDADGNPIAVLWTSPTAYELLPTPDGDTSVALGIDAAGDIVGIISDPSTQQTDAVLWTPNSSPVPEPASLALLLPAAALLLRRRTQPPLNHLTI